MTYKNEYKSDFERYVNDLYDRINSCVNELDDIAEICGVTERDIENLEGAYNHCKYLVEAVAREYGIEVY